MGSPQVTSTARRRKLNWIENLACIWPAVLGFIFGGALGGVLGVISWGLNLSVMGGPRSAPARYGLVTLLSLGAVAAYLAIVLLLLLLFPALAPSRK